jgi:hypothetical protein
MNSRSDGAAQTSPPRSMPNHLTFPSNADTPGKLLDEDEGDSFT